ncbi:MAG: hypothetical protein NDI93_00860 [Pseudomonas sp.]|nr:hypothetical protein [Pseudomonas sp.]
MDRRRDRGSEYEAYKAGLANEHTEAAGSHPQPKPEQLSGLPRPVPICDQVENKVCHRDHAPTAKHNDRRAQKPVAPAEAAATGQQRWYQKESPEAQGCNGRAKQAYELKQYERALHRAA